MGLPVELNRAGVGFAASAAPARRGLVLHAEGGVAARTRDVSTESIGPPMLKQQAAEDTSTWEVAKK